MRRIEHTFAADANPTVLPSDEVEQSQPTNSSVQNVATVESKSSVIDYAPILQKQIDALAGKGGVIQLEEGIYPLSRGLRLNGSHSHLHVNNVTIKGRGALTVLRLSSNTRDNILDVGHKRDLRGIPSYGRNYIVQNLVLEGNLKVNPFPKLFMPENKRGLYLTGLQGREWVDIRTEAPLKQIEGQPKPALLYRDKFRVLESKEVYEIRNNVEVSAGNSVFRRVRLHRPLSRNYSDELITNTMDNNNRYFNGIYIEAENVQIKNVRVSNSSFHGIMVGSGPRNVMAPDIGDWDAKAGKRLVAARNVEIENVVIENGTGNGIAIAGAQHVYVKNSKIRSKHCGIQVDSHNKHVFLQRNEIDDSKYGGVCGWKAEHTRVQSNQVFGGVYCMLFQAGYKSLSIAHNICHGTPIDSSKPKTLFGIYLQGHIQAPKLENIQIGEDIWITNNRFRNIARSPHGAASGAFGSGIKVENIKNVRVHKNLFEPSVQGQLLELVNSKDVVHSENVRIQ